RDTLLALADESIVRVRGVGLHGAWWRREAGPLVAFRAADDQPVALLPRSPDAWPSPKAHYYQLADPVARTRTPVTAAVAATLAPVAYTFTRPFPAQPLGVRDLIEFGLRGCRHDLLLIVGLGIVSGLLGLVPPLATGF